MRATHLTCTLIFFTLGTFVFKFKKLSYTCKHFFLQPRLLLQRLAQLQQRHQLGLPLQQLKVHRRLRPRRQVLKFQRRQRRRQWHPVRIVSGCEISCSRWGSDLAVIFDLWQCDWRPRYVLVSSFFSRKSLTHPLHIFLLLYARKYPLLCCSTVCMCVYMYVCVSKFLLLNWYLKPCCKCYGSNFQVG